MIGAKWIAGIGAVALVAALALLPAAQAQEFEGDLTTPSGGAPFGGDVVGSFEIEVEGHEVEIVASVDISVPDGHVLEGWLVDMDTGYKLSLGMLQSDLEFEQNIVNPWTYGVLVITMEPAADLDPNPAMPVAGALLPAPFGQ